MIKHLLIILFMLNSLAQAGSLSYTEKDTLTTLLSKKETQLSKDMYLNLNLFTALSLVDDRFVEEYSIHKENTQQPMLTLSYRF